MFLSTKANTALRSCRSRLTATPAAGYNAGSASGWETLIGAAARVLGLARADRIAAVFCGSKKTLASGVPMAKLMFGANPALGVILLPIMIYHPLQLVVCGVLAERWGREK